MASCMMARPRLCGLPVPVDPVTMRSLDGWSLSAARISLAYQAGRPAATRPASDRCRKPRRDRFPRSIVALLVVVDRLGSDEGYDNSQPRGRKEKPRDFALPKRP